MNQRNCFDIDLSSIEAKIYINYNDVKRDSIILILNNTKFRFVTFIRPEAKNNDLTASIYSIGTNKWLTVSFKTL